MTLHTACGPRITGMDERTRIADDLTRVKDDRTRVKDDSTRVKQRAIGDTLVEPPGAPERERSDRAAHGGAPAALPAPAFTHDDPPPLPIGTVIRDRFELESMIGRGSMGAVYRAVDRLHREMHDRDPYVAIKVLSEKFKQFPKALMTLQREVRKAQVLAHENIISVYTFDRDGSIAYMTMELLDGKSLSTVIAEHPDGLPPGEAATMIVGMAKALAYAHHNGIVHSDFKPSNVFLTRKGQIKVLDFGVARAINVEPAAGGGPAVPQDRELGGFTPAYASIEMLRGEPPVPADDVFALAIVAHELLTGRHPFGHAAVDTDLLRDLGTRELKGLRWSQKKALSRAISKTREARYEDAGRFLRHFTGSDALRVRVLIGVLVAAMLALVGIVMLRPDAALPVTAFEDLPAAVQEQFNNAIREGETALRFGDAGANDAFSYFSAAYELHPNNPRAIAGLEAVADRFLGAIETADTTTQRRVFELLYCQDYLARYEPVATACEDSLGRDCDAIARGCLSARGR